ncbi:MAG: hypothetical protein K9J12_07290 [Melioribacteraceae bacterium]|nr:hypothetical protein [Melioribacteraceae bacterium]MCF8432340.1 hypothetical protein [Melioribacteraceae bacterium]
MKKLLVTLLFVASAAVTAQEIPNYAVENIKMGLQSENPGLRKSCINFIAKYNLIELQDELIEAYSNADEEQKGLILNVVIYLNKDNEKSLLADF